MKRKKGVRADRVFFCTTIFFAVLLLVMFICMDRNYNELLEVNDTLVQTIDENRATYNKNLEAEKQLSQEYYSKYAKEYSLRMNMEERLKEGVSAYTQAELDLLAKCVQAEAGNPITFGNSQKLVCQVILNRVDDEHFPDTIEEVIYQNDKVSGGVQFSVAYDGALDKQEIDPQTMNNVYEVIMFGCDIPHEIQYFYSANLKEDNWVKKLKVYETIEGTVFCYDTEVEE